MTIELYNKSTGEMVPTECWETASPHFVVTKPLAYPNSEFFNVTHRRSGALALGPFTDKRADLPKEIQEWRRLVHFLCICPDFEEYDDDEIM